MVTLTPLEDWLLKTALVTMGLIIGYFLQREIDRKGKSETAKNPQHTDEVSNVMLTICTDIATLKSDVGHLSKLLLDLKKEMERANRQFTTLHDEHIMNHKPP